MEELALLHPLWKKNKVVAVWLFGSRARGEAREDSDWDLALLFKQPYPGLQEKMSLIADVTGILKTDKVDIVFLHDAPLVLQKEIVYDGKVIFETDWDFRTDFEEMVVRRWLDFEPVWQQMTRDLLENLKEEFGGGESGL
ncbi:MULTISPECIES: nucleotidyltransferase domain-containing protein [Carboxydocella]|uniref:Nucleotidyltransferase domain-containing protein n=2 Tax=Carboxydocella TaxID=178898 RepID=A0A1T4NF05_9FIRM|nr:MULTISPECIES: nucleotidyltransferase domain-containing protein [Carboxydocella]AVX20017.1 hypothetical protein CFE_0819 [Carboxydocella thermautotrophica]AVX30433.1 hypothetical protein CTH_0833 [Carboxydocella thermautotrophica]SJZ77921.1 Nucleotidyltransferase domain-containing protein [Carboxydocella sporoproducens DSM 16521]GAW30198.1 hypothetical protein ULO1_27680 [Carboxydocella sp. ULO1]GAW32331.1 hypothetical protein JDF658_20960 [Carboxydocella sp. JDF658]